MRPRRLVGASGRSLNFTVRGPRFRQCYLGGPCWVPGGNQMDNLLKVRIFAVVALKMCISLVALVYALRGLYILCAKYAVPFPPSVYRLLLCGGFGAIAGYAVSSYKKRANPSQEKGDKSSVG